MSRTKRVAITVAVVAAGTLGLAGMANASDYNESHVDVAGVDVGGVAHTVGDVTHDLGGVVHDVVNTVHDAL